MRWRSIAFAALSLSSSLSCTNEEIVAATVQRRPPDGGHGGPHGCESDNDCRFDEFCAKPSCQDAHGMCAHRPLVCSASPDPVCGCDGIDYFNDCLRKRNGVAAATPGECSGNAAACGGASHIACPDRSRCVMLFRVGPQPNCPVDASGACWVLPDDCGTTTSADRWMPCGPPAPCVDTCTAMRSAVPHWLAPGCP